MGLAFMGLRAGINPRNKYWQWRMHTAFGSDESRWPSARERRRAMLEYGEWVWNMRRYMR